MIAAFLPLPFKPPSTTHRRQSSVGMTISSAPAMPGRLSSAAALEKNLHAIDQERYDSARWWRNLNRVLSLLGLFVISAIVSNILPYFPLGFLFDVRYSIFDAPVLDLWLFAGIKVHC